MSDLIRYTETFSGMEPDDIGDWVKFKDAKALQEEVIRLYKEVGKAKSDLLINAADNNDTISNLTQRLAEVEIVAKQLWGMLDDISTAGDMYKPDLRDKYVSYVMKKCERKSEQGWSDGYEIFIGKQALSNSEGKCLDDGGDCGIGGYCSKHSQKHKRDCQKQLNTPYGLGGSDDDA